MSTRYSDDALVLGEVENVLTDPEGGEQKPPRPTLDDIRNLVLRQGGTLGQLPYNVQTTTSTDDFLGRIPSVIVNNPSGLWGPYWFQCARDARFMRQEIDDEVKGAPESTRFFPQNWTVRVPSTCPDKVRQATDQLYSGDPVVKVRLTKAFRNPQLKQEQEEFYTQLCQAFLQKSEANSESTLVRDAKLNVFSLGLTALSTTLNRAYPEEPKRRPGEKLKDWKRRQAEYEQARRETDVFQDEVVHPLNVCYDRAHKPMQWVVTREAIEVGQAAAEYPHWKQAASYMTGGTTTGQGSAIVFACRAWYWSRDYVGCYINGEPAYDERDGADENGLMDNPYGFIPFWPAAGGHGQPDFMHRPQYELKGIIRDARDVLLVNAILYNLFLVWMHRVSYGPKTWIKGPDDVTIVNRLRLAILGGPNVVENIPDGYAIDDQDMPAMPPALLQLWERNLSEIDKAMFSDILSGQSTQSEPASRTRERLRQVDKRLNDSVLHITQAVEGFLRGKLKMLKHVLRETTAWNLAPVGQEARWVTLKADDIPYDNEMIITVELTGDTADEEARNAQMYQDGLGKWVDLNTMLNEMKFPNPQEIVAGLELDSIRENNIIPTLSQVFSGMAPSIVAQALQDAGLEFTPQELADAQAKVGLLTGASGGAAVPQGGTPAAEPAQVTPDGAQLPSLPGETGGGYNAQVANPNSPEADMQRARLLRRPLAVPAGR